MRLCRLVSDPSESRWQQRPARRGGRCPPPAPPREAGPSGPAGILLPHPPPGGQEGPGSWTWRGSSPERGGKGPAHTRGAFAPSWVSGSAAHPAAHRWWRGRGGGRTQTEGPRSWPVGASPQGFLALGRGSPEKAGQQEESPTKPAYWGLVLKGAKFQAIRSPSTLASSSPRTRQVGTKPGQRYGGL